MMKITEKNRKVSCMECIYRRRILTCYANGKQCAVCKNVCCCRKCSPDASGGELEYEQRRYFSAGMPMGEYIQMKDAKKVEKKIEAAENLQTDKNGQLRFFWNF